jgi:hypothetical protein
MDVSLKFDIMQLLFILTLINAATHSMAKGIKHDVASTHAKDQLSDATSGATNGAFFLILTLFTFLLFVLDGRRKTHSPFTNTSTQTCIFVLTLRAFPSSRVILVVLCLLFYFFLPQAVDENTGSTIQRTLLSTRRLPSTRRLLAKTFIHVVTSGKCAEKAYTDVPSTWNNVDPALIYRSHQGVHCNRLSIALRGNVGDNTRKNVNNINYPGRNCFWDGGNTGELRFNQKGDEPKNQDCSNNRQCICFQPCDPGFFGSYDSVDCVACHPGRFSATLYVLHKDDPSLACEACGVGKYQFDTPAACTNCPAGWYNDQKNQVECVSGNM